MSFSRPSRSHSLNYPPPLAEKLTDEPVSSRTAQSTVTCVYMASIAGHWRRVTVTWCKNLMHHFFTVTVHAPLECSGTKTSGSGSGSGDFFLHHNQHQSTTCKVDLKPWHFWSKKGYKSFELDDNSPATHAELFWDVRAAKFGAGPEPWSEFYVAVVCDGEVALLVGDIKKKAFKRTKSRPAIVEAVMCCKRECVFAKRCFSTRAQLDGGGRWGGRECDVVVETAAAGREPEMWISVDGIVVVHVRNLQWKFRGNQSVSVNGHAVQVFWDVHDWLFTGTGGGRGLFVFKPGTAAAADQSEVVDEGSPASSGGGIDNNNDHFCLFLQAWKIE